MSLAGSRGGAPCGVWGNAPTVPRATSMQNAPNKGAGSEASLPVTLRIRRCAPNLLYLPLAHCRAKWARPTSIERNGSLAAGLFCCRGTRLRVRQGGNGNRRSLRSPSGRLRLPCYNGKDGAWGTDDGSARGHCVQLSPTQSRERVKGGDFVPFHSPLQGAGTASLLGSRGKAPWVSLSHSFPSR